MNQITSATNAVSSPVLYEKVTDLRVHSITLIFLGRYGSSNSHVANVIKNECKALRQPYQEGFKVWSPNELERYYDWQLSPIVLKLNHAILSNAVPETANLSPLLTSDEFAELETFNASDIGKKKEQLDQLLKPQLHEVATKIHYLLVDQFSF